uniref:Uncharacterized protein n=1 Tax=Globodera rostochiensis TaxID=31243 RepID=A0A914HQ57_GLORO
MNAILVLRDPNSTTAHNFYIYEAGDVISLKAYKQHLKKVSINGNYNGDVIEKKLLCYALATFFGHAFVASHFVITDIWLVDFPKIRFMMGSYYPLFLDTGIVVLSSCLLLWASGKFRQQLIDDFSIIRKTNIQIIRVGPMEGHRNNNHRAVGGAVGHQLQTRFSSSVQQLATSAVGRNCNCPNNEKEAPRFNILENKMNAARHRVLIQAAMPNLDETPQQDTLGHNAAVIVQLREVERFNGRGIPLAPPQTFYWTDEYAVSNDGVEEKFDIGLFL